MTAKERDIELIEKYIDKSLSEEEEVEFETRIKDDGFVKELNFRLSVTRSIEDVHRSNLRSELKAEFSRNSEGMYDNVRPIWRQPLYWAAALLLLGVIGVSIYMISQKPTPESVYMSFYKPYPATSTTRGDQAQAEKRAFAFYSAGDYVNAAVLLEDAVQNDDVSDDDRFMYLLLGNCYMNLNAFDKAYKCFEMIRSSGEDVFSQHAEWYYALTLLKEKKVDQSIEALMSIKNSDSIYATQSEKLLQKLK